ncbi:MAG: MFS transporter [Simkania negevensis]|nr:MFS transporter [Simkania negevensis]
MKISLKSILPPLCSLVIVMLGGGFFNTFTNLRISLEGVPPWVVGFLSASYNLGLMLGSLYVEKLINRIGHIRSFAIFASINSLIIILQSQCIGPIPWAFFRFSIGICTSGFFIVIQSWLLLSGGIKLRGQLLACYMVTLYLAQGCGQFILGITPLSSFVPFVIAIALSSLSVIPVCMNKNSGPLLAETPLTPIFQVLKKAPLGVIGSLIAGMIISSFIGLTPIFGKEIGLSVGGISTIMGCTILGGLFLQWPIGILSDLINRRTLLLVTTLLLIGITFLLFHLKAPSYFPLLTIMILFGACAYILYPLSISYTSSFFSGKKVVSVSSALLIVYGIGSVLGPLISPFFMEMLGPKALFLYISFLSLFFFLLGLWRIFRTKPLSEEEQGDYLSLPHTTSLPFYLDPGSDLEEAEELEEEEGVFSFAEEFEDEEENSQN